MSCGTRDKNIFCYVECFICGDNNLNPICKKCIDSIGEYSVCIKFNAPTREIKNGFYVAKTLIEIEREFDIRSINDLFLIDYKGFQLLISNVKVDIFGIPNGYSPYKNIISHKISGKYENNVPVNLTEEDKNLLKEPFKRVVFDTCNNKNCNRENCMRLEKYEVECVFIF